MENDDLKKSLRFDSLSEAEKITGKSYKEDESTVRLGMALMLENNKIKNALLEESGDTKFTNSVEDYLSIAKSIGFEVVLIEPFTSKDGIEENLYILWNKELGILLKFDSFTFGDDGSWAKAGKEVPPPGVNGGNFYYNIKLKPYKERESRCTSGGGFYNDGNDYTDIWIGSHDCREGLKHHINLLKENGEFLPNWVERPFLWLLNYCDTKGEYDYNAINQERITKLPQHVIEAISPNS